MNNFLVLSACAFALASFSHWRTSLLAASPLTGYFPLLLAVTMFIAHAFGINSVLHLLNSEVMHRPALFRFCQTQSRVVLECGHDILSVYLSRLERAGDSAVVR